MESRREERGMPRRLAAWAKCNSSAAASKCRKRVESTVVPFHRVARRA
jgi:hypothetical protein